MSRRSKDKGTEPLTGGTPIETVGTATTVNSTFVYPTTTTTPQIKMTTYTNPRKNIHIHWPNGHSNDDLVKAITALSEDFDVTICSGCKQPYTYPSYPNYPYTINWTGHKTVPDDVKFG